MLMDNVTLFGQADPARCPVQESDLQGVFEDGNAFADQRIGNAEFASGGRKAVAANHGAEQAKVFQKRFIVHET